MPIDNPIFLRLIGILESTITVRAGRSVPDTDNVLLGTGAVSSDIAFLFADLEDSTILASRFPPQGVAKVYKAFLACAADVILRNQGRVRSFDGDRILGVFDGENRSVLAVKTALQLNGVMSQLIVPMLRTQIDFIRDGRFPLRHRVGIDSGNVMAIRTGIRNNNHLAWIGGAPNIAAKLAVHRSEHGNISVTQHVFGALPTNLIEVNGNSLWHQEQCVWPDGTHRIYASSAAVPIDLAPILVTRLTRLLIR